MLSCFGKLSMTFLRIENHLLGATQPLALLTEP